MVLLELLGAGVVIALVVTGAWFMLTRVSIKGRDKRK